jgi:hypothetical protein
MNLGMEEAVPLTRACGHYLNLSGIAELHHGCVCTPCDTHATRVFVTHAQAFLACMRATGP